MITGFNRRLTDWSQSLRRLRTEVRLGLLFGVLFLIAGCGPSINSSSADDRRDAVRQINDQAVLAKVALEDSDMFVRQAAIENLTDQEALAKVALSDKNGFNSDKAFQKITDQAILAKLAFEDYHGGDLTISPDHIEIAATRKLLDQAALINIASKSNDVYVRETAIENKNLTDQAVLAKIAREDLNANNRGCATQRLTNQEILARIATDDNDKDVRDTAVTMLTDQSTLAKVAVEEKDEQVRGDAVKMLTDQTILEKLVLEDQDVYIRAIAAEHLTDKVTLLKTALGDQDAKVRKAALKSLGTLGDPSVAAPLSAALPNWDLNSDIGSALKKMNWQPTSEGDQVYYWISTQDGAHLKAQWDQTKRVLLADVQSGDQHKIENAVYTFVSLGSTEVVPHLVQILNANGNQQMAVTFLNCGSTDLEAAARAWCQANNYEVQKTFDGVHASAAWGNWK